MLVLLIAVAGASKPACTYTDGTDVGDPSSILASFKGNFTEAQCCARCQENSACAVAALLDATHGDLQGCWLKTGAGTASRKAGATACYSGRAPAPAPAPTPKVALTMLDPAASPHARCMDGSMGGFYLAANASSSDWIIELEGGGECASKINCDKKQETALASSNYFAQDRNPGFLSVDDAAANPRLRTFNRVFIPYCSQDLWTGQRTTNGSETFGYYFAGHLVLEGVLDALDEKHNLRAATRVVLTGESAGGMGVWPNVDWLAQRYDSARVVAAPIAGFYFFAYPYTGPGHTSSSLADFRKEAWPAHYELWASFVDEDCKAALSEPGYCVLANNSFPFVSSHAFIMEAQTDKVVLGAHDWVPTSQDPEWSDDVKAYMSEWHRNMTVALAPSMDPASPNGVFNPACFIHTTFNTKTPLLGGGLNFIDAFSAWLYADAGAQTKLQDDCGILCNPSCAH